MAADGSGVLGLAGLAGYLIWWWCRIPARPDRPIAPTGLRCALWIVVGGAIVASALVATVLGVSAGLSVELIAYRVVTWTGAGVMLAVGACASVWWYATRGARRD